MNDIVIKAESLGKKYTIGHQAENGRYVALRDVIAQNVRGFWNKTKDLVQGKPIIQGDQQEEIWALKDVSFEVKRGEAIGIIGRNGAGKSTLLKVLSRITEPTTGRVTIKGRVASLLEVGTGFHPELTGRENIYLNGAILGMSRAEIKKKFDEIVAFAEIEKFLDTPIKRYSSGMYVRLAFAVAAHLDPEILLVDEVLAVGDAQFQKKCIGKMKDVTNKDKRTVLFVSHNIPVVMNLCGSGLLLKSGCLVVGGRIKDVVERYMATPVTFEGCNTLDGHLREGSGNIQFVNFEVTDDNDNPIIRPDLPIVFKMTLKSKIHRLLSAHVTVAMALSTAFGEPLIEFQTCFDKEYQDNPVEFGETIKLVCRSERIPIKPDIYFITLYVDYNGEICDHLLNAIRIEIKEFDYYGTGKMPSSNTHGRLLLQQKWFHIK